MKTSDSRKHNILIVSDIIFPDEAAGSGRMSWVMAKELSARGHTVTVLTKQNPGFSENETIENIKVCRYRSYFKYNVFFRSVASCRRVFRQLAQKISFDLLIIVHPFSGYGVITSAQSQDIPKIYNFNSPWHVEYEIKKNYAGNSFLNRITKLFGSMLRRNIEKKVISSCRRTFALSEFMRAQLIRYHGINPDSIEVIPAGVELSRFKPPQDKDALKRKLRLPVNKIAFITVRNLLPRMGLDNLIEAFDIIINQYNIKNILLTIGGKGDMGEKLKALAAGKHLEEYVHFAGVIPDDPLPEYYGASDIFILPTEYLEGFGLIILEALACGVPVLATPVGAIPEIVEKLDPDLLFKGTSAQDMAEKIKYFIENPGRLEEIRKRCRGYAEKNYSWGLFFDRLEYIASGLIDTNRRTEEV
jgi:glycosyltransferase involved in cell wall biosynthesis